MNDFIDPEFDTPDEFDLLMRDVPMVSPWETAFAEAEETLRVISPEGFTAEDIGRVALDMLPEFEKEAALDVLFYTYWAARMQDRETRAHHQAAGGAR